MCFDPQTRPSVSCDPQTRSAITQPATDRLALLHTTSNPTSMARSKNAATRRPDEEIQSRPNMKLRSPSVRRPASKLRFDGPPKPTTGFISADTPPQSPARSPEPSNSQPVIGLEVKHTERARAILTGMKRLGRMKKLAAIKTPPPPPPPPPTTTPRNPDAQVIHQPLPRQTPPRKAKNMAQPSHQQKLKRKANPTYPHVPPEKRKAFNQSCHATPIPSVPLVPAMRSTLQGPEEPPAPANPTCPRLAAPIPHPLPQTPKSNPIVPRRSPRGVSKSTGRSNANSQPAIPNFSDPNPHPMFHSPPPSPPMLHTQHASPAISNEDEPPAPDFDQFIDNNGSDDESEVNLANVPSIRCKSLGYVLLAGNEGVEKRNVRGVVNGTTLANYKLISNKGQVIKVEFLRDGSGPANGTVASLLHHEIGSAIRDKVPMMASSFKKLSEEHRRTVYDHLSPNFLIDRKDDQLWNHIFKKATERYRDWKSSCKAFFQIHGPEVIPREFLDRPEQWKWLMSHFSEPKNQERGKNMSRVRNMPERMNHTSGKCPFYMRAAILADQGEKAPRITTFSHVYSKDPVGAALARQMQAKVQDFLQDRNGDESEEPSVLNDEGPLPLATELDIITQVIGQKRGTYISGTGKCFKRPPLPRGGARNSELKEQLQQQKEEFKEEFMEMKAAFEQRIRVLEELVVRGASANHTSNNASEGATSYGPAS